MQVDVLLVDDEKDVLKALTRVLYRQGISVAAAESGEEALAWLQAENSAALIVSDYRMTGMSGTEFLAKVEAQWPQTGRIILSGHADFDTVLKAVHTGVVHKFLAKPWSNQEFIEHIKTSLASRQLAEQSPSEDTTTVAQHVYTGKRSEIKLQVVLDTVVDGIVTINAVGRIVSVNSSMERIFGYSAEEMLDNNISMLMPEPYRCQHDHYLQDFKSPGIKGILGNQRRLVGLRKNGEVFPIELSVNSMQVDDGAQFLGMIRDISQSVKAESQNQLLIDALEVAQYGVALFGAGDRLIHWNQQFFQLYQPHGVELFEGLTYTEFFRQCLQKGLFQEAQKNPEIWLSAQLEKHDNLPLTQEYPLTSGQWIEIRETQAENGSLIVSHLDISKQKQTQLSLEQAVAEAEFANNAKGRFLAMMSHEIRTPLNGVLGILQLLQDTQLSAEQADYIKHAISAGDGLLTIISDILDFSKVAADKLELIPLPCQLTALVAELEQLFRLRVEEKSIQFNTHIDVSVPDWVELDGQRLRQILLNLVGNAVKFTDAGEVSLHIAAKLGVLYFKVKDTGLGIPLAEQGKVFSEFSTIDRDSQQSLREGTGLGLAISHKLIALMGGEISFDSEQGVGSTFRFHLPYQAAEAPQTHEQMGQLSLRGTVLVVDDSATNQLVAKIMLNNLGVDVICAASGEEALQVYRSNKPIDLILMDISMPGMSGIEAFEALQQLDTWRKTPVIAFTAYAQIEDKRRFHDHGMQGHLEKPLDKTVLLQTIAPYLNRGNQVKQTLSQASHIASTPSNLLDITKLDQLAHDTSEQVLPELVAVFQADAVARIQALSSGDIEKEEAQRHFHTLGSSGALYGLTELSQQARHMEQCCLQGRSTVNGIEAFIELAQSSLDLLSQHMQERSL